MNGSDNVTLVLTHFIVLCFLYYAEFIAIKKNNELASLESTLLSLDVNDVDPRLNGTYIFFKGVNTTSFPILYDNMFNLSINAAVFYRDVSYCQWHEYNSLNQTATIEERYKYYIAWSSELIDSQKFVVKEGHQNPSQDSVNSYFAHEDFPLGAYSVDASFTSPNHAQTPLLLNETHFINFSNSEASKSYNYIGNGNFYKEYTKGSSEFLKKYLDQHNTNVSLKETNQILGNCQPGDISIRLLIFAPPTISMMAYRNGTRLIRTSFNGQGICFLLGGTHTPFYQQEAQVKKFEKLRPKAIFMGAIFTFLIALITSPAARLFMFSYTFISILIIAANYKYFCFSLRTSYILFGCYLIYAIIELYLIYKKNHIIYKMPKTVNSKPKEEIKDKKEVKQPQKPSEKVHTD